MERSEPSQRSSLSRAMSVNARTLVSSQKMTVEGRSLSVEVYDEGPAPRGVKRARSPPVPVPGTRSTPGWMGSRAECPSGGHPTWAPGMSCSVCWRKLATEGRYAEHQLAVEQSLLTDSPYCRCEDPRSSHRREGGCWTAAKRSGTYEGWCEPCYKRQCCEGS